MAQVLGFGGVFFKAKDKAALCRWYSVVSANGLNTVPAPGCAAIGAGENTAPPQLCISMPSTSLYMAPSTKAFMLNFAVDDLDGILARCKEHGVEPLKPVLDEANGRFAHILDPEGTKLELWQPKPFVS